MTLDLFPFITEAFFFFNCLRGRSYFVPSPANALSEWQTLIPSLNIFWVIYIAKHVRKGHGIGQGTLLPSHLILLQSANFVN